MNDVPDILAKIIATKWDEVVAAESNESITTLRARCADLPPARGFAEAITQKIERGQSAVIAEIKRASPSKGLIREQFEPDIHAAEYQKAGAACISVLTDELYFQGHADHFKSARESCDIPMIRKDFMVSPYHIYQSRLMGADCILLIVAALDDESLHTLFELSLSLGMDCLVEVHNEKELERALTLKPTLLGINNRNLKTFETTLTTTINLKDHVDDNTILVTESGLNTPEDIALMRDNEIHAFLVGEAFMRAQNPGDALTALFKTA